jgi:tetratricopeptide (TPR) repeat protein
MSGMPRQPIYNHSGFLECDVQGSGSRRYIAHHLYGSIPVSHLGEALRCDPEYRPRLPPGALRADVRAQRIEGSTAMTTREPVYGIPRYFYCDVDVVCVVCRAKDVFSAREQKQWYETYKIPTYVEANRCSGCRKILQTQRRLTAAVAFAATHPTDANAWLEEARRRMELFKYKEAGDLAKAMACLRKAARLDPGLKDVTYWEGVLYERRLQPKKALAKYREFLEMMGRSKSKLRTDAEKSIARLTAREVIK